jgi:tetratricopeptide (TPR) repeat protein
MTLGRVEEAIREIKLAHELEPFSLMINTGGGEIHYLARQYDAAIERLRLALDLEPNFVPAHTVLAQAYERKGMVEEAAAELEKVKSLSRPDSLPVAVFGRSLAPVAKNETSRGVEDVQELSKRRYVPACCLAALYHCLGNRELTFEWMEKALEELSNWLTYVRRDPLFDNLHSDPRFESIMRRIGLPAVM